MTFRSRQSRLLRVSSSQRKRSTSAQHLLYGAGRPGCVFGKEKDMDEIITAADFLARVKVNVWEDDYAEELLRKFFPLETGFGELS